METINLTNLSVWPFVKVFFVIALFIYMVFSLVVVRQSQMMDNTLKLSFGQFVKTVAWIHFFFAIGVLILAITIL